MGKKRKKSAEQTPTPIGATVVIETTESVPPPPVSQPAVSAEMAAELVAEPIAVSEPPPPASEVSASEPPPASEVSASDAPASAAPATKRPKKKRPASKKRSVRPPPVVSREALDQKIDRLEAKLEEKKDAVAKAAREGFGSKPDDDDTSVPPVDLEVHDAFFAAGEKAHVVKESGSFAALDPRQAQKMSASAHARRAHLSRYVKIAVGAAAGILMLGFAIKSFRGHPSDEPVRREVTHVAAAIEQPVQQEQPKAVTPPPAIQNVENADKVVEAKPEEKKDDTAAAADAKATEETTDKKDDLPPEKPKNAWQEKQAAKAALERGANATAIQAGERSVALDPSDGEAWLVLGGAYQAMGNASQAKRCYSACVNQGKKGPISDCKDMLGSL